MSWPYLTSRELSINGTFKGSAEDFKVIEIPLYEPCGSGEHLYIYVEKRGLTTDELIKALSKSTGIPTKNIGYAGKKDRTSISRQWISLWPAQDHLVNNVKIPGLRILAYLKHRNKLRKGHLKGNRFEVILRDIPRNAGPVVSQVLSVLSEQGIPNYFGPQRFGMHGDNAAMGAAILQGHKRGHSAPQSRFFVNALQSYWFNCSLAKRLPGLNQLETGDLAYIHRNGAVFLVHDGITEQERLASFEISPSGPMWGDRMTLPGGRELKLEKEVIQETGLTPEQLYPLFGKFKVRGERRSYRVLPANMDYQFNEDSLHLRFELPAGSYATSVIRELLKANLKEPEIVAPEIRINELELR